jgi:hypothetical protein
MIQACRKRNYQAKDIRLCTNCGRAVRLIALASGEIVPVIIWPGQKQKQVV